MVLFAEQQGEIGSVLGYAVVLTKVESDPIEETRYTYGTVTEIVVTATARGKRIGPMLLKECEQRVKDAGGQYLRTEVLASNPQARKIYQRFGFQDHPITMEKKL